MTKDHDKEIEVINPGYAGATPEDVGRALLKHRPADEDKPVADEGDNEEDRSNG